MQVQSLGWEEPLEEGMATHPSILAWRTCGQRNLKGCNPRGRKESDMTEDAHTIPHRWHLSSSSLWPSHLMKWQRINEKTRVTSFQACAAQVMMRHFRDRREFRNGLVQPLFFFFLVAPCGMQDLISPRRIKPVPPAMELWNPNHGTTGEFPQPLIFYRFKENKKILYA